MIIIMIIFSNISPEHVALSLSKTVKTLKNQLIKSTAHDAKS